MTRNVIRVFIVAIAFTTATAFAANSAIGVATALAAYSIDNSEVTGSATVFEGAELRTTITPGDIRLASGAEVRLATRSAGAVFNGHMILEQGAVRVANFENYEVRARRLEIQAESPNTQAIVRLTGRTVEVASMGGTVKVTDGGAMMTRVAAGTKMSFQNANAGHSGSAGPNSGQSGATAGQSGATPGQSGATAGQTGAAPEAGPISDKKAILWAAGVCAVGAIVVGSIAAAQGKNPF